MLFYAEALTHQLTKGVNHSAKEKITHILDRANKLFSAIPKERFDFDRARKPCGIAFDSSFQALLG